MTTATPGQAEEPSPAVLTWPAILTVTHTTERLALLTMVTQGQATIKSEAQQLSIAKAGLWLTELHLLLSDRQQAQTSFDLVNRARLDRDDSLRFDLLRETLASE